VNQQGRKNLNFSRILKNFGFLTFGKLSGDIFTFVLFVLISRKFGQEGIGQYSFAMAFTGFFMVISDFGLFKLSIKEMSRGKLTVKKYFGKIYTLRLLLCAFSLTLLYIVSLFLPQSEETILIIYILGIYQIFYTLMDGISAVFVAHEEMGFAGLMEFSSKAITSLSAIAVMYYTKNLIYTLAVFPVVAIVFALIAYITISCKYGSPSIGISFTQLTLTLHETLPYGISMILRQLGSRVDVIFLGFILSEAAAGIYNVAYRFLFLLFMIPNYAAHAIFPLASNLYIHSRDDLLKLYQQTLNIAILIGIPVSSGLWLIAPDIIIMIFGDEFQNSILLLRYLAGLFFLSGFNILMGIFLTACDQQAKRTKAESVIIIINIIGNAVLIPVLGIKGAAIATLSSEIILSLYTLFLLRKLIGQTKIGFRLVTAVMGSLLFCLPFELYFHYPIYVTIPASILIYIITLTISSEIRNNEIQILIRPNKK
jgi:O-antigen/teichoic acid export membrane protein